MLHVNSSNSRLVDRLVLEMTWSLHECGVRCNGHLSISWPTSCRNIKLWHFNRFLSMNPICTRWSGNKSIDNPFIAFQWVFGIFGITRMKSQITVNFPFWGAVNGGFRTTGKEDLLLKNPRGNHKPERHINTRVPRQSKQPWNIKWHSQSSSEGTLQRCFLSSFSRAYKNKGLLFLYIIRKHLKS